MTIVTGQLVAVQLGRAKRSTTLFRSHMFSKGDTLITPDSETSVDVCCNPITRSSLHVTVVSKQCIHDAVELE